MRIVISGNTDTTLSNSLLSILLISVIVGTLPINIPKLSEVFTGVFAIIGGFYVIVSRKWNNTILISLLFATYLLLYSISTEGLRYFLLIIAITTWIKFKNENFLIWLEIIVWYGIPSSISQIYGGSPRVRGFLSSPPQFACMLYVCQIYLLIFLFNNYKRGRYISKHRAFIILSESAICLWLIFLTGTRSIFLFSMLGFLYFIICYWYENSVIIQKKIVRTLLLICISVIVILSANYLLDYYYYVQGRSIEGLKQSNLTRIALSSIVVQDIQDNPWMLLFGKGGGYVEALIRTWRGTSGYTPVHQDFLLILAEYGILGFIFTYYVLIKRHSAKWLILAMFIPMSFHNIILNTKTMLLFSMVIAEVEFCGYRLTPRNREIRFMELRKKG